MMKDCPTCGYKLINVRDGDSRFTRPKCMRCEGGYYKQKIREALEVLDEGSLFVKEKDPPYWKTKSEKRRIIVKGRGEILLPPMKKDQAKAVWRTLKQKVVRCKWMIENPEKYNDAAVELCKTNVSHLGPLEEELRRRIESRPTHHAVKED